MSSRWITAGDVADDWRRFPFPFDGDAWSGALFTPLAPAPEGRDDGGVLDVDAGYVSDCQARVVALDDDPSLFQARPQAMLAQWETLELIMEALARDYPGHFALSRSGARWIWENRPLNVLQVFTFGEPTTLPQAPLEYAARQAPGDWLIVAPRDGALWVEAALATADGRWANEIEIGTEFGGIEFGAWQGLAYAAADPAGLALAAQRLAEHTAPAPLRRFDWSLTGPVERPPPSGDPAPARDAVARRRLCVGVQTVWRLPRSQAFALCLRRYERQLGELVARPQWARRLHGLVSTLPAPLAERVGVASQRDALVAWLARVDARTPGGSGEARS